MKVKTPYRVRGWHVLAGMIVFFVAIIAVNVAFAVAAIRSFPGEDQQQAYMQGLRYNETLSQRRAQADLGWTVAAELTQAPSGARLQLMLRDAHGAPIDGAAISGALRRPADQRLDRALVFVRRAPGIYTANTSALAQGRWQLRARATDPAGATLDFDAELSWPTL